MDSKQPKIGMKVIVHMETDNKRRFPNEQVKNGMSGEIVGFPIVLVRLSDKRLVRLASHEIEERKEEPK